MTEGLQNNQFIPSIIIALDEPSEQITKTIRNIFYRRSIHQTKVCDFFTFYLQDEEFEFFSSGGDLSFLERQPDIRRPDVFSNLISQVSSIQEKLIDISNAIEDHNRLINAGYILDRDIPINYFLVADAKEIFSGGVILPIIFLINDIVIRHQNSKLHVLLNVASFQDSQSDADIQVYTLLQEFLEVFSKESEIKNRLCENLKIRPSDLSNVSLYLFHNKKENTGEVVDNHMMKIMVGNALLTLLLNDIARKFSLTTREANVVGEDIVFNSIGSVVTAYDPKSLQEYLARKLAIETVDEVLLVPGLQGSATTEANRIKQLIGDFHEWNQELLSTFPDPVTQIIYDPLTKRYEIKFQNLRLENIVFLEFQTLDWHSQVERLEELIFNAAVPECQLSIQKSAAHLSENISKDIKQFSENLLLLARCYPGGIDTIRLSLQNLKKLLLSEIPKIHQKNKEIEKTTNKPRAKLEKIKKTFSKIADRTPAMPKIVEKIPDKYQELFATIYYHLTFLLPILILRWLRSKVPNLLHEIAGANVHMLANQESLQIINDLCDESGIIELCLKDLDELYIKVKSIRGKISYEQAFPLGQTENAWAPFFRIPILTESIAENLYETQKWTKSDITDDLIVNKKLFEGWKNIDSSLQEKLLEFHRNLFKKVWVFDLADIHHMFLDQSEQEVAPLTSQKIQKYLAISQPLLRPTIETGQTEYAQLGRYFLLGDLNWTDFNIPEKISAEHYWQTIWIDDPYSLIISQAWHNLKYGSIAPLFDIAKKNYERLSSKEKSDFGIVSHRSFVSIIKETSDFIEREYQWQFLPKNSNKTYTFSIRLDIDLERYRKYAAEERLNDIKEWNHYAQSDMPELNNLAIAFQKIFLEHNWSTYNKAFCVLKFVQNAITYQKDKFSKGTQQWSRYPIETLAEGTGDCEDVSILCVAILVRMGFDVVLLYYTDHPDPGHVAFGVCGTPDMQGDYVSDPESGKKYYFGEATNDGWLLGEIPEKYKDKTPEAIINIKLLVNEDDPEG